MRAERIAMLYGLLKQSRTTKMEDQGRMRILRIIKALRPAAQEYEADLKEAREKMKDGQFDAMTAKAEKWQMEGAKAISDDEKMAVNAYFARYNKAVNKAVEALAAKQKKAEFDKLSPDELKKLISSNDYTGEQMELLDDMVVEQQPGTVSVFSKQ
ncbi:MAG: hypothetical protein IJT19_07845 [Bacteroidaceae bacterium]|nr:hypothetical protein [Bacteroidaceae bacterium]